MYYTNIFHMFFVGKPRTQVEFGTQTQTQTSIEFHLGF